MRSFFSVFVYYVKIIKSAVAAQVFGVKVSVAETESDDLSLVRTERESIFLVFSFSAFITTVPPDFVLSRYFLKDSSKLSRVLKYSIWSSAIFVIPEISG